MAESFALELVDPFADDPEEAYWEKAFEVWLWKTSRNLPDAYARMKVEEPAATAGRTLADFEEHQRAEDWNLAADRVIESLGPDLERQTAAMLLALGPVAVDVYRKGLTGELTLKTDNYMLMAAREVLNRIGFTDRLTEPMKPRHAPRGGDEADPDDLLSVRERHEIRTKNLGRGPARTAVGPKRRGR